MNNAGKSYTYPEDFHASARKDMEDIVNINVNSVVRLTHIVLPGMVERSVRHTRSHSISFHLPLSILLFVGSAA